MFATIDTSPGYLYMKVVYTSMCRQEFENGGLGSGPPLKMGGFQSGPSLKKRGGGGTKNNKETYISKWSSPGRKSEKKECIFLKGRGGGLSERSRSKKWSL